MLKYANVTLYIIVIGLQETFIERLGATNQITWNGKENRGWSRGGRRSRWTQEGERNDRMREQKKNQS